MCEEFTTLSWKFMSCLSFRGYRISELGTSVTWGWGYAGSNLFVVGKIFALNNDLIYLSLREFQVNSIMSRNFSYSFLVNFLLFEGAQVKINGVYNLNNFESFMAQVELLLFFSSFHFTFLMNVFIPWIILLFTSFEM